MRGSRLLVIDDDESVRRAVQRLLQCAGYAVQTCSSASAAREVLKAAAPDPPACLIVDVRMPGCTGLELVESLNASGCNVPVVFMTGHSDVSAMLRAVAVGAVEFLTKPFDAASLFRAVDHALQGGVRA
jgi:two-component system, LuxR family, response regulator FixJ